MGADLEVGARIDKLSVELGESIGQHDRSGRRYGTIATVVRYVAVGFSSLAVILSLIPSGKIDKWMIGMVAAVPGIMALSAQIIKFQQKSNWQCRKAEAEKALRRRLLFEMSEFPTVDDVKAVAAAWDGLDATMQEEWERTIGKELRKEDMTE